MDKIQKALKKLTEKERELIRSLLDRLARGQTAGMDIAKLKGHADIFRIRKGTLRIIFRIEQSEVYILKIDRRNDTTYREF